MIGFLRESRAAAIFGDASAINDAFVTAWRVPNLFRSLLGEGAMSTSLQTELTKADAQGGLEAGRRLFLTIAKIVFFASLALCGTVMLAAWLAPDRMPLTGWSWLGADPEPVRELVVRMMPFVVFVCLSAVASGALFVRGRFLAPSLAPVLMNVWWITALWLVVEEFGFEHVANAADEHARQFAIARRLAAYVLIAGLVLLLVQVPALVRERLLGRPAQASSATKASSTSNASNERVWSVLKNAIPLALGAAVYQINVMVGGLLAQSLLERGGASILYYATRVQQLPLSLVSLAATSAVFPALTALGHERRLGELRSLHDRTHLAICYVALPASLGLALFAEPVMAVCFEHGHFGAAGVARGALGLRALTLAILPAGAAGLIARTYYAVGDFRTPVRISIGILLLNIVLDTLAVTVFGFDLEGLALATALCSWLNVLLLLPGLTRRAGLPPAIPGFAARAGWMLLASAVAVGAARGLYEILGGGRDSVLRLGVSIVLAGVLYAGSSQLLAIPEWQAFRAKLSRKHG